jgi:AcrR family transcriptional regulator
MGRRSGDETRALLLRVGMQMLLERGVSAGVQHIRLQDVLRHAGLTTGAAYRLWADQNDYQRDLAVAMVRLRLSSPADYARTAVEKLVAEGASGDDIIRAAAEAHVRSATVETDNPAVALDAHQFLISLALRTTAQTWPELKDASLQRHHESIAAFAEFYAYLMEAYGLRMKSPLTVTDFTEAMAAMGEGFAVRALEGIEHPRYDASETDDIPAGSWTLFALGVRALVNEFMTSVDDAEPGATTTD